jgi:hypothetical protein
MRGWKRIALIVGTALLLTVLAVWTSMTMVPTGERIPISRNGGDAAIVQAASELSCDTLVSRGKAWLGYDNYQYQAHLAASRVKGCPDSQSR